MVGEGIIDEPPYLLGGCPHASPQPMATAKEKPPLSPFKFGRMFRKAAELPEPQQKEMIEALKDLGWAMNAESHQKEDSNIPSGYTYLGQFIAHEITFDKSENVMEPNPDNWRSPHIDLDSLYGDGPEDPASAKVFEADLVKLKIGPTTENASLKRRFWNDLPRQSSKEAILIDPRNDENLATAQTHVAFIAFHNKVVDLLRGSCPDGELFKLARREVVRHFQWIILKDYLPRIVDEEVLDCVIQHQPRWFTVEKDEDLFMPLEFSAAAFRMGHSMVRDRYEWNDYHSSARSGGAPQVCQLFDHTRFSSNLGAKPTLDSDWVIDWRRFYNFTEFDYDRPEPGGNFARKIDPSFDLHLDRIQGYPHHELTGKDRSITVRNLLRGFALRLPTGEQVAEYMGLTPLSPADIAGGPHQKCLDVPLLKGKTPLWYYILKEAELMGKDGRLGPTGSRIIAETFVCIIKHSSYSIFDAPEWRPLRSRRKAQSFSPRFEMADLLDIAGVVDPINTAHHNPA